MVSIGGMESIGGMVSIEDIECIWVRNVSGYEVYRKYGKCLTCGQTKDFRSGLRAYPTTAKAG